MSHQGAGRTGHAKTSAGTVWDRQASGYHRFFGQFTIPVARLLLDAARVTAEHRPRRRRWPRVCRAVRPGPRRTCRRRPVGGHARLRPPRGLLPLMRAGAGTLPVADGAFTAVVAGFCLPHMADPAAGTAELARALAPGGWLAVAPGTIRPGRATPGCWPTPSPT